MKVFLPCRSGSQRVKNKNTRQFANFQNGLIELKISQLVSCREIDEILVSTNDPLVIEIAEAAKSPKVLIDKRRDDLCANETTTDSLISYVIDLWDSPDILWTHVTCPFFEAKDYSNAINAYFKALESNVNDSLMGCGRMQTFLWSEHGPLYERSDGNLWPFSQNIEPIYDIDSTIFIVPHSIAIRSRDRIGFKPMLFENNGLSSIDIDTESQFDTAQKIWCSVNT
jgi:CMP-N-acetylneuraminic acid synthetase